MRKRTANKGKWRIINDAFRLSWMSIVNKYFDSDLCLSKIKLDAAAKTIGFDAKNNKLAIVTYDRGIFYAEIP